MTKHYCRTTEDGWRTCPPDLCEIEVFLNELKDLYDIYKHEKDFFKRVNAQVEIMEKIQEISESIGVGWSHR